MESLPYQPAHMDEIDDRAFVTVYKKLAYENGIQEVDE